MANATVAHGVADAQHLFKSHQRKTLKRAQAAMGKRAVKELITALRSQLGMPAEGFQGDESAERRWFDAIAANQPHFDLPKLLRGPAPTDHLPAQGRAMYTVRYVVIRLVELADLDSRWLMWARALLLHGLNDVTLVEPFFRLPDESGKPAYIMLTADTTLDDVKTVYRLWQSRREAPAPVVDEELDELKRQLLALKESGMGYRGIGNTSVGQQYLTRLGLQHARSDMRQRAIFNLLYPEVRKKKRACIVRGD